MSNHRDVQVISRKTSIKEQTMSKHHSLSRRDFMKLAGAGLGAAALASCKKGVYLTEVPTSAGINFPEASVTPLPPEASAIPLPLETMADTILANGRIMTVDATNSIAEAIAIKGNKILTVGTDKVVRALASSSTKVIELNGRTVTPGFIDPHLHFNIVGLQNTYYTPFMPPEVTDIPSLQRALADYLKNIRPDEWVMGYYLGLTDKMIPTKEDLDPVSSGSPVFIMHIGGHWGTANSIALQIAGVTNNTPSPEGGIIEKVNGELTGVFYNHRAMDVLRRFAPPVTVTEVKQAIIDIQKAFASCGVTCFHDNNIRSMETIQAYQELTQEGKLYLRNELYLTLEWPTDMDHVSQVQPMDNGITHFAGYKFLIDGQGPTAYCHEATNGVEWRMPTWEPQMFKDTIKTLHDTGLQICVHCIGDAATDLTLEAYEAAMNANPRSDPRHRIEHAVITTPQATQKMKGLGVVVSTQPAFIYGFGEGWKTIFTPAQMERVCVTREWLDAGVHVAIGSDAPSMPLYYPQATLAGTMTRYTRELNQIGGDQVLNFTEALHAHTYEGAYSGHQENNLGTLEAGKFADLVVWPEDPSKLNATKLANTKTVDMTMVDGKVVYEKA
jgi:predicted amidohydrolase YtcJ